MKHGTIGGRSYLVLRRKKTKATLKIQSEIMHSVRRFFEKEGFLEVLPPILEPFTDPGIRGARFFEVDYYGTTYKVMSALTIHKPILATHLGKIFCFLSLCQERTRRIKTYWKTLGSILADRSRN